MTTGLRLDEREAAPPGRVPRSARRRARPSPVCWAVLAILLVPLAAAVLARATNGWVPEGDDAWVARRTMQVVSADPPLIGQESTASEHPTDRGLSHPGPIAYYLMAVPYAASGWSPVGLAVGAGLVAAVALAASVVLAWRTAGDRGAVAVGIAIALVMVRLGTEWLGRPLSSASVVLPLLAALVGLWAYRWRDRAGLAVALLAGTYCVQTSLVVLPFAGAVLVGCAGLAWWHRRQGAPRSPMGSAATVLAVVLAVMWLPPLVDALVRAPGNLGDLGEYLLSQLGLVSNDRSPVGNLGLGASFATVVTFLTTVPGAGSAPFGSRAVELTTLEELALVPVVATAIVAGASVWWSHRHGSNRLRSLLRLSAAALVVAIVAFSRRPTDSDVAQPYFVIWIQAPVALTWAAFALAGLEAGHAAWRRRPVAAPAWVPARPAIVVGLALTAVLAMITAVGPVDRTDARRVAELSEQVRERVPPGTYLITADGFVPWNSTVKGLGADLLAHGYDIRFWEWGGMVDEPLRRGARSLPQLVVSSEFPEVDGLDVVARRRDAEVLLVVRVIPGGADTRWCEAAGKVDAATRVATQDGPERLPSDDLLAGVTDAAQWTAVLISIDALGLREATQDVELRRAVESIERTRASALEELGSGVVDEPVPELRSAVQGLLAAYRWTCDARSVEGVTLAPAR